MNLEYDNYPEEELIEKIHSGDQEAMEYLLKKYSPLVKKSTRTLYLIGADSEDLSQEGMIGLFKAIQNYRHDNEASFYTFAKLCIERQLYSAIRSSNRKKHFPLNSYVSFYSRESEGETELIDNLEAGHNSNPEHIVLAQENISQIEELLNSHLGKLEAEVLPLFLDGMSYSEIAGRLGKTPKSIDNAVQRIRDKVNRLYLRGNR